MRIHAVHVMCATEKPVATNMVVEISRRIRDGLPAVLKTANPAYVECSVVSKTFIENSGGDTTHMTAGCLIKYDPGLADGNFDAARTFVRGVLSEYFDLTGDIRILRESSV